MNRILYYNDFISCIMTVRNHLDSVLDSSLLKKQVTPEVNVDIVALKEGDHRAFERVFHKYYGKVKEFIRIITKSEYMADELSQSVFVNIWTYRQSIDPRRNFDAYLYTVTRNAAMNALKKQTRNGVDVFDCPDIQGGGYTDEEIIAKETELLVKMTVNRMPPKRKLVFKMSRYDNKTNDEISKELDISKKMVEKHLRDSLSDIKEVLRVILIFWG